VDRRPINMKVAAMLRPRLAHYAPLRDGWLRNDEANCGGGLACDHRLIDLSCRLHLTGGDGIDDAI